MEPYLSQAKLIEAMVRKDDFALATVQKLYGAALYGIVCKVFHNHEARIAVFQKAISKIWFDADQYDPEKLKFFTWMLNIVRQTIKEEFQPPTNSLEIAYKDNDLLRIIHQNDYPVFIRVFFHSRTIAEIGEELFMSTADISKSLYRAIKNLNDHFAQSSAQ